MKWLWLIVASEVGLLNKKRADVTAYNEGKIVVIEVQSSHEDYKQDQKWSEYLSCCDKFYFFLDFYVRDQTE